MCIFYLHLYALYDHFEAAKFLQERTGLVRVFGSTVMVEFRVAGRPSTPTGVILFWSGWLRILFVIICWINSYRYFCLRMLLCRLIRSYQSFHQRPMVSMALVFIFLGLPTVIILSCMKVINLWHNWFVSLYVCL